MAEVQPKIEYENEGEGFGTIELSRPVEYEKGENARRNAPRDTVQIRNLPSFLKDKFKAAAENIYQENSLARTLDHYTGQMEGWGVLDAGPLAELKALAKQANQARSQKERQEVYKKTVELLGTFRTYKRGK